MAGQTLPSLTTPTPEAQTDGDAVEKRGADTRRIRRSSLTKDNEPTKRPESGRYSIVNGSSRASKQPSSRPK